MAVEDTDAAKVLEKISRGDGLPSDQVIERISSLIGEKMETHEFTDHEMEAA